MAVTFSIKRFTGVTKALNKALKKNTLRGRT